MVTFRAISAVKMGAAGFSKMLVTSHHIKARFRETGCEDGKWMELTQDCVQKENWYQYKFFMGLPVDRVYLVNW
jgi:hypothetical protein